MIYMVLVIAAVGFLAAITLAVAWTADLLRMVHEQEEAPRPVTPARRTTRC